MQKGIQLQRGRERLRQGNAPLIGDGQRNLDVARVPQLFSKPLRERHRLIRALLRNSAAIPCLGLVVEGVELQTEIQDALGESFAERTTTDGLHLLVREGALTRLDPDSRYRGVRYSPTALGHELVTIRLGAITDWL